VQLVQQAFVESHRAAGLLVGATVLGSIAVEWAVTARERMRTTLGPAAGKRARSRVAVWTFVETATARTADDAAADRGTKRILVGSMVAAIVLAWWLARAASTADVPGSGWTLVGAGLVVMWLGIGLRVWSIAVLGRFFRRDVVVQEGHRVVADGPYGRLRHPAYAGNLLAAAGLGLALANWLSLAILVVVPFLGHVPRIRVEEAELERSLGDDYRHYEARTSRLLPGVW
jgi:protein-S-isoprenylcysteine O-methyltransferase Ste14